MGFEGGWSSFVGKLLFEGRFDGGLKALPFSRCFCLFGRFLASASYRLMLYLKC